MTTIFPAGASVDPPCEGQAVASAPFFERILRERLRDIEGRYRELSVERVAEATEQSQILERNDMNARQASHDRMMARLIRAALERIKDGTFGFCISCDARISEKRLQAVPFTPHCLTCAERVDRRHTDGDSGDDRRDSGRRLAEYDEVEAPGRRG